MNSADCTEWPVQMKAGETSASRLSAQFFPDARSSGLLSAQYIHQIQDSDIKEQLALSSILAWYKNTDILGLESVQRFHSYAGEEGCHYCEAQA